MCGFKFVFCHVVTNKDLTSGSCWNSSLYRGHISRPTKRSASISVIMTGLPSGSVATDTAAPMTSSGGGGPAGKGGLRDQGVCLI